ncbi:MAG: helix-turn-helix transcriptional regulator [Ignavibacteria bacterium]|nr:helix-turn-helix transcriptional regulator [Ignavibacteria bacterium]
MRILIFIFFISSLGPFVRFYKHNLFYFFFISAIADPLVYFITSILGYTMLGGKIYLFANLMMLYSLPNIDFKYKFSFTVFILFYSIIARSEVTMLIIIIFIMVFTVSYFINELIKTIKNERNVTLFLVPLIVLYTTGIFLTYYYYANPNLVVHTINYKFVLYIILNILVTIWGPDKKFLIINYFPIRPPALIKKYSENELILLGLSAREIEVYNFILRGFKNSEIADKMFVDKKTIESHLWHIKNKLAFKSVNELRKYLKEVSK